MAVTVVRQHTSWVRVLVKSPKPSFHLIMSNQKSLQHIFAELPLPFCMANVPDIPITGISIDSRAVKPGHLFVAMKGGNVDAHDYIPKAIENGAVAVVGERELSGLLCSIHSPRQPAPRADVDRCRVLRLAGSQAEGDRRDRHGRQDYHDESDLSDPARRAGSKLA